MAEYIEREAAIAFMNEVEPCICRNPDGVVFTATKDKDMLEYLRSIPAADVVHVVRCGDCENWQSGWKPSAAKDGTHFCAYVGLCTSADWFCADGARMDGDGDV